MVNRSHWKSSSSRSQRGNFRHQSLRRAQMENRNVKLKMFHIARSSATTTGLLLMLLATALFAAKSDKSRAFENGGLDESRIASHVRHELLLLPYYGVFDDLAFRVEGDTVTLLG